MSTTLGNGLVVVETDSGSENIVSNPRITSKDELRNMPGGRPKSGRVWKNKKER